MFNRHNVNPGVRQFGVLVVADKNTGYFIEFYFAGGGWRIGWW